MFVSYPKLKCFTEEWERIVCVLKRDDAVEAGGLRLAGRKFHRAQIIIRNLVDKRTELKLIYAFGDVVIKLGLLVGGIIRR